MWSASKAALAGSACCSMNACQPAGVLIDLQDADVLERRQPSRRGARITPPRLRDYRLRYEQVEVLPAVPPFASDLLVSCLHDVAARRGGQVADDRRFEIDLRPQGYAPLNRCRAVRPELHERILRFLRPFDSNHGEPNGAITTATALSSYGLSTSGNSVAVTIGCAMLGCVAFHLQLHVRIAIPGDSATLTSRVAWPTRGRWYLATSCCLWPQHSCQVALQRDRRPSSESLTGSRRRGAELGLEPP
jgi:hypothetical protein